MQISRLGTEAVQPAKRTLQQQSDNIAGASEADGGYLLPVPIAFFPLQG